MHFSEPSVPGHEALHRFETGCRKVACRFCRAPCSGCTRRRGAGGNTLPAPVIPCIMHMGQMGQYQTAGHLSIMPRRQGVEQHPIAFYFHHFTNAHDDRMSMENEKPTGKQAYRYMPTYGTVPGGAEAGSDCRWGWWGLGTKKGLYPTGYRPLVSVLRPSIIRTQRVVRKSTGQSASDWTSHSSAVTAASTKSTTQSSLRSPITCTAHGAAASAMTSGPAR